MFANSNERLGKKKVSKGTFLEVIQKRLINTCLPALIVQILSESCIVTATDIIFAIEKHYSIQMSPGTVYPVLNRLEKNGYIKRLSSRRKKIYTLTNKGSDVASQEIAEVLLHLEILLNIQKLDKTP